MWRWLFSRLHSEHVTWVWPISGLQATDLSYRFMAAPSFIQSQRGATPHELGGRSAQSCWEPSCHHLELRMKQTWAGSARDWKKPGVQWHMSHFSRWQLGFTAKWAPKFPFCLSPPDLSLHSPATENSNGCPLLFFKKKKISRGELEIIWTSGKVSSKNINDK